MVLELLNEKGLVEESEGARVIFIEGKNIPLIVVKRDGGFNYASTDLTALWLVYLYCSFEYNLYMYIEYAFSDSELINFNYAP